MSDQQFQCEFDGAGTTDTVHESEGQAHVTLQQITKANVLILKCGT